MSWRNGRWRGQSADILNLHAEKPRVRIDLRQRNRPTREYHRVCFSLCHLSSSPFHNVLTAARATLCAVSFRAGVITTIGFTLYCSCAR
ncbi:hypothetical protein KCP71_18075 [Salmonella enterica subsp. enterica]|nr:hypothetical protein KCP71_18075 [Salmonella enterica subsp. enterica]